MSLEFREITPANWREIKPEVKEEQKEFVAPYTTSLARAYVYRKDNSIVFAIYHGKDVVGLLMQRDYLNESGELICILDQFLIDKNFQDQGFGEAVMRLWLAKIKSGNMLFLARLFDRHYTTLHDQIKDLFIEFTLFALYKTFLEQEEYQVANLSGIFNNL